MTNPMISVAMPFYNSEGTLALAIRSILEQSFEDFELLLCDDGSTDRSLEIARGFNDPRVLVWSDGGRRRLAARLNECIGRARGAYLARMDADDVAYPDRFAAQAAYLRQHSEIDLCGGGALVFGLHGQPLWRFTPALEHAALTRSPFRGFPLWHPTWMGRTEWFRQWRYDETALLAQDQELLLRSFRESRFANLPQVVLGYRQERVLLKKLFRYKVLWTRYVCRQTTGAPHGLEKLKLVLVQSAKFAANCIAVLGGPQRRMGRQGASAPTPAELIAWQNVWRGLSAGDAQLPAGAPLATFMSAEITASGN